MACVSLFSRKKSRKRMMTRRSFTGSSGRPSNECSVFSLAASALWAPRLEPNVFPGAPSRRADIAVQPRQPEIFATFASGPRRPIAIDAAVVSPFTRDSVARAAATPGGAATAYEARKVNDYGDLARRAGIDFTPLIVDVFGAWGESALPLLKQMAVAWGKRFDLHPSRAIPLALASVSSRLAVGVARLLLANAAATEPTTSPDREDDDGAAAQPQQQEDGRGNGHGSGVAGPPSFEALALGAGRAMTGTARPAPDTRGLLPESC